jgi:hypothetical protein
MADADPEVDRYRRVASGVRKKLVGLALEHVKKHDDLKSELLARAADHRGLEDHPTEGADGADMGSEHAEPGHAAAEGEDDAEFRGQQADVRASDLKGDQPEHLSLGKTGAEQDAEHEEKRNAERANDTSGLMERLSAAASPKSGSEATAKGEDEESKTPDVSDDPDTGEPEWKKMVGKSQKTRLGKTTRGIIGAYKGGS